MVRGLLPRLKLLSGVRNQKVQGKMAENNVCIRPQKGYFMPQIDNSPISKPGKSSVEPVFSDDLRPDGREQWRKGSQSKVKSS